MFKTDPTLETKGIVLNYGDFKITVARAGGANKAYVKCLERKSRPYRRAIQAETMDNELATAMMREVYVESVVLGWEGVLDAKGKSLPFSKENALQLFTDLPDLFQDVMEQAGKAALFREEIRETEAKN